VALSLVEAVPRLALMLRATGLLADAGPLGNLDAATLLEGIGSLFLLASMVAFCFWIYRANANLHAFGIGNLHSPGWAVGTYFIPVVSLWLGYGVMREVWDKSGPPDSVLDGKGWLLPVWWGSWVITNILSNILWRMESAFEPSSLTIMQFAAAAMNVVAGTALIAIVTNLDVAQQQQESFEVF
jgi:hypothetical protein